MNFEDYIFEIKNYLCNILFNSGDGAEFMQNSVNLNGGYRVAGKRRKKNSSKAVAQSCSVSSLKRLNNKSSVFSVLGNFGSINSGLFDTNH